MKLKFLFKYSSFFYNWFYTKIMINISKCFSEEPNISHKFENKSQMATYLPGSFVFSQISGESFNTPGTVDWITNWWEGTYRFVLIAVLQSYLQGS